MVFCEQFEHVHGKFLAFDDPSIARVWLLQGKLLQLLYQLSIAALLLVQLAQNLSFAPQQVHRLFHLKQGLEGDLHLSNVFKSKLLKVFFRFAIVQKELFQEKTRHRSRLCILQCPRLDALHESLIQIACVVLSHRLQLGLSLGPCCVVRRFQTLKQSNKLLISSCLDHSLAPLGLVNDSV